MAKKIKLEKWISYNVQPIKGESYHDCEFPFGKHKLLAVDDEQCFRIVGYSAWWDSKGFEITEIA